MDLTPYVENLRRELAVAADAGGDDARALAERLTAPLESAIRLMLLDALSAAADEITRELAPGSVELRLRAGEPDFVVTPTPADEPVEPAGVRAPPRSRTPTRRATARINLRLPEQLKAGIEQAASRERLSVNAWLVRAAAAALATGRPAPTTQRGGRLGQRYTGWVRWPQTGPLPQPPDIEPDHAGGHPHADFRHPEPISVTIDLGLGDVRIRATDTDTTVVEVQPERRVQRGGREGRQRTRVEYAHGQLRRQGAPSCAPDCPRETAGRST